MIQITIASVNVEAPSWQKPSPPGVSWDNPEVNWFLVKTFQTPAWICPLDHPYHSLAPLSAGDGFEHLQNSRKKYSNCIFFWFWLKMASYWIFLTKLGAYYVRRPALLTLMGHQLSAKIQVQLGHCCSAWACPWHQPWLCWLWLGAGNAHCSGLHLTWNIPWFPIGQVITTGKHLGLWLDLGSHFQQDPRL